MCQVVYFKTVYVLIIYVMQAFLVSQTELLTLWIPHSPTPPLNLGHISTT